MSTEQAPDVELISELLGLINELVDPDDCNLDHHGGCQAHGYLSLEPGDICPHAAAKTVLDAAGIDWR